MLQSIQASFNLVHDKLEELDFDEIGSSLRCNFAELVVCLEGRLLNAIQRMQSGAPPCSTLRQDDQSTIVITRSRLPELKLPTFSGGYTEYADFASMFTSVIAKDPDLSDVEKLQHLRSSLRGSALGTIRALEISGANYSVALDLLDKRFNNKRLIFQAHISEILGIKKAETTSKLRELSDKVNANMRALLSLGNMQDVAGSIVVQTILGKVDAATQAKWEEAAPLNVIPSWEQFATFLDSRCQKLENIEHAMASYSSNYQVGKNKNTNTKRSFVATNPSANGCLFCDINAHEIYSCPLFGNLSPVLRLKEAKRLSLCINCLRKGHRMRTCNSGSCRTCGAKHHSLLHFNNSAAVNLMPEQSSASDLHSRPSSLLLPRSALAAVSPSSLASLPAQNLGSDVVLLATAVISIQNRAGTWVPCRALLDSGSQLHIITSRFAHRLQLRKTKSSASVSGLGDVSFKSDGCTVHLCLQSLVTDYSANITALVAPSITENQPNFTVDISHWDIPSNVRLADPAFFKPQQIDMLIGANVFYELLCVGQIKLADGLPLLQKTRLGWIVTGGGSQRQKSALVASKSPSTQDCNTRIEQMVRSFWELESGVDPAVKLTKEEFDCEEHFKANYRRLRTGEYSVRLPVKLSTDLLGDSYTQAYRRFINLERKLERNPLLKAQYSAFIKEYLELGHMSLVSPVSLNLCKYFLPHHCVLKEDSTTTKLRVVFDGSASTSSGHSLNDILMAGPSIQSKLANTLLRFRTFPIALTGDICKMYRCVRVSNPDSYFQCILWRDSPQKPIQVFRLDTVTYGTKPASFLSVRTMHQLAEDEHELFPIGSDILRRDFYVDDLITGGASTNEVIEIMRQTTGLLAKANFKLRKWCSSNPDVLKQVPEEDKETLVKFDDGSDITKTLGLSWDPATDLFIFTFLPALTSGRICKRTVLSTIARFYDPLGLIGPVIAKAKIFLQALWRERLDWDESLSASLTTSWHNLIADFERTKQLKFPRLALSVGVSIEVHGFSDASIDAYGACVYIISTTQGQSRAELLCSRSRVAPLKSLTVPRLELCGAVLLAQLINEISRMELFDCKFYCWSDSAVALSWIRSEPSRFQIFVSNRIATIQELTSGMEWRYIPTDLNPADILSRGALPSELVQSNLWLHGPAFLTKDKSSWPESCNSVSSLPEQRSKVFVSTTLCEDIAQQCKYVNTFGKLQRVFAYVYKFLHRVRIPGLSVDCIRHGTLLLMRSIQMSTLRDEYKTLQAGHTLKSSSSCLSLSPFLDSSGLMRVGGRLSNSALDFEAQHPIILPRRHPVTRSVIMHYHVRNLHSGPRALLASIRLQYWPIGGRKTVCSVVSKCTICFRAKPRLVEHVMADLPKDRVDASHTFMVTGVDFCGPFFYKSEVRNKAPIKCYICIFICFATKAVHLELVKDLTTGAFLNALKRFILTRCRPTRIWSDNATNFVGARNEMAELKRLFESSEHLQAVQEFCLADCIDWRFIPPRSPHFGGLWEAAVKTAKHHFYRSVGLSLLEFDELRTLVCHIGAIINSRPLLSLSEHPADLDVLTPAHFLGAAPLSTYVEPDLTKLNFNRLDRWQRVTYYQQIFWARWREEYLTLLQQRSKWRVSQPGLSIDDVVLVKDENLPPLKWPLARVVSLISGADGVSRVAELRTSTGTIRRAVRKLCPLPKQDVVEDPGSSTGGVCLVIRPKTAKTSSTS